MDVETVMCYVSRSYLRVHEIRNVTFINVPNRTYQVNIRMIREL